MIKQLLYKWFGLESDACPVCEVLREQLHKSEAERKELLQRALTPPKAEPPQEPEEEHQPILPQFTPWRVRQNMLEAEDRKKAELLRKSKESIAELEKELQVGEKK